MGFRGTLQFLTAVREKFGSNKEKYYQFLQIATDFIGEKVEVDGKRNWKVKVSGDEIIRRSKELFGGDEKLIIRFYNLLLDSRRKHERPDDFWAAFNVVKKIMMIKGLGADYSEQQGCADMEIRMEDTDMTHPKKQKYMKLDSIHQAVERGGNMASSGGNKNNLRDSSLKGISAKAENRVGYEEKYIDMREKLLSKWKRDKTNERLDNSAPEKHPLSLKKKNVTACGPNSSLSSENDNDTIGGLVSEVGLNELLKRPSCTPSYRLLPEKITKRLESQRTDPDAPELNVLNNSWVSVYRGKYLQKKKKNKYEEILFLLEDDMYELDMLIAIVNATAEKVVEIEGKMSDPSFKFDMEKAFTGSNLRCLMQFYYHRWANMLKAVRKNAAAELSKISMDLKEWVEYLKDVRVEFHKLCLDVYAENEPKLIDRGNHS